MLHYSTVLASLWVVRQLNLVSTNVLYMVSLFEGGAGYRWTGEQVDSVDKGLVSGKKIRDRVRWKSERERNERGSTLRITKITDDIADLDGADLGRDVEEGEGRGEGSTRD